MCNYTKPEKSVQTDDKKPVTNPYDVSLTPEDINKYFAVHSIEITMKYYVCSGECMEPVPCEKRLV